MENNTEIHVWEGIFKDSDVIWQQGVVLSPSSPADTEERKMTEVCVPPTFLHSRPSPPQS